MSTVVYSMADATRRFGVCPASAMAVVMLAKVLLTTDDIPAASSAAKYSLKLLERFADDAKNISAKVEYIALYHVAIRTLPPAVIANQIRDAHERSKDTGDIEWLCQSHTHTHTRTRTDKHTRTHARALSPHLRRVLDAETVVHAAPRADRTVGIGGNCIGLCGSAV